MSKEILGVDLKLRETSEGSDLMISKSGDLELIKYEENLGQALLNRLRTRLGELSDLGHPNYGSTLYEVVGQPNSPAIRRRVRAIVRETVLQEPRVESIVWLRIFTSKDDPSRLDIDLAVKPVAGRGIITLVFPFFLEVI